MAQMVSKDDTVEKFLEQVNDFQLYEIMIAIIHRQKAL